MKALTKLTDPIVRNAWKKLVEPTVSRGKTAWPKSEADQLRYGIRFDYDGIVSVDGVDHYKFQCQPNNGRIPSSIKDWREKNGGTHAVMTTIQIKKGATEKEVREALDKAFKEV